MNYDPIHDTYTPSADHPSQSIDGLNSAGPHYNGSSVPMALNGIGPTPPGTSHQIASSRPASNLHQLLDNTPQGLEPQSQWKVSGANGQDHSHSVPGGISSNLHDDATTAGALHHADKSRNVNGNQVDANTGNSWGQMSKDTQYSERDVSPHVSPDHKSRPEKAGPYASRSPLKDAKLSIGNLVGTESPGYSFINPSVSSNIPGDGRNSGRMDSPDQTEDSKDVSPEERSLPLGSLPENFLSMSSRFKHLKKSDGEPFWRRDIQHDFLEELFNDQSKVFTNNFPHCEVPNAPNGPKLTFAELYVRTLAESSKSSRVLRERLIKDHGMGLAVSKVCLLVNAGRMNTTVNFVPDMRSVLRTYHSIPSLQASPDGHTKPLQDTPRLKTILKAVCEGQDHLQTLLDVWRDPPSMKPNTNVIKLIFLMSTFYHSIPYQSDNPNDEGISPNDLKIVKPSSSHPNNFMEFFLSDDIYPKNRARRFLWLMYTYMETSFTDEELLQNPFNPRVIPPIELISPADQDLFDNDTELEIAYATKMFHTRMAHLNEDAGASNSKRGTKTKRDRHTLQMQSESGTNLAEVAEAVTPVSASVVDLATTVNHGHDEVQLEFVDESAKIVSNQDRAKRKKPTPSVGSLLEDKKNTPVTFTSWKNPTLPAAKLKKIRSKFLKPTGGIKFNRLNGDNPLSVALRKTTAMNSKNIVAHMAKFVPNFDERRKETTQWMYRYFQYKKSTGNGLLAMEWEDIRHDLILGFEAYSYQQLGKSLESSCHVEQTENERHENGDSELLKKIQPKVGLGHLPGDSAPIDIDEIDALGSGFAPSHDFDRANERSTYEYMLTQFVSDTLWRSVNAKISQAEVFKFDLEAESLHHK